MTARCYELELGACTGHVGTASSGIWILERDTTPKFTAKTFVWIFGSHQECQRDSSHLEGCTPFTCDAGNRVEGRGETEAEAVEALKKSQKTLAESLWD